jgi:hypothetical protein
MRSLYLVVMTGVSSVCSRTYSGLVLPFVARASLMWAKYSAWRFLAFRSPSRVMSGGGSRRVPALVLVALRLPSSS